MEFNKDLIDKLKNAIAKDKLFIITGTGVSNGVVREDGKTIPSWGKLVKTLKEKALDKSKDLDLINKLVPDDYSDSVHGNSLIEASQLLSKILGEDEFSQLIINETREKENAFSETQNCIAKIPLKGIITFNYDRCHENAFKNNNIDFEKCLYWDNDTMVKYINFDFEKKPLLLKAHGCINEPKSLILTGSSYANILNKEHVYRAFIQHIFSRFTILILGFGLRDRDFDQILNTMEKDYGSNVQDCIAIMRIAPKSDNLEKEKTRILELSNYATLEARYGLKVLTISEYSELPELLKIIVEDQGTYIKQLINDSICTKDKNKIKESRKLLGKLSTIGKLQARTLLLKKLKDNKTDDSDNTRSEIIYVLGLLKDNDESVVQAFISECEQDINGYTDTYINTHLECVAHSLVGLRSLNIKEELRRKLIEPDFMKKLLELDQILKEKNQNPRLVNYCQAAYSEIIERSSFYTKNND